MTFQHILRDVASYYTDRVRVYGATARGVDWNSTESQILRFTQIMKVCDTSQPFSINDYGCGYGALVDYLVMQKVLFEYRGFDISGEMIVRAQEIHKDKNNCMFISDATQLEIADYTIASGIFNVKHQITDQEWGAYLLETLNHFATISRRGFAFNVLTKYSDPEKMRADLYYADPLFLFDYCKKNISKFVALLHDYPLYEFTILVRMSK